MRRIALLIVLAVFSHCFGAPVTTPLDWEYNPAAANGPSNWGNIRNAAGTQTYPECALQAQSPINFANGPVPDATLTPITFQWTPVTSFDVELTRWAATLKPVVGGGGLVNPLNGQSYDLKNVHFHSASEHTFGGSLRDMEAHFVHQRSTSPNDYLVIGVTFNAVTSGYNTELVPLWSAINNLTRSTTLTSLRSASTVSFGNIVPAVPAYFTYSGSLTLPPCSQGVTWFVLPEPLTISAAMLTTIRDAMGVTNMSWTNGSFVVPGNYRPAQPLNGRTVRYYQPQSNVTTNVTSAPNPIPVPVPLPAPAPAPSSSSGTAVAALLFALIALVLSGLLAAKAYMDHKKIKLPYMNADVSQQSKA